MFGHGHGFDREKPPDLDKMWKDFNNRINRLFRWKKKRAMIRRSRMMKTMIHTTTR
ncbi:protease modulator HflK N-terminal domain-containing protein [Oxalobacter formigenes]|nr:protease modulator HflK N-terminal domain-containing protein [Oxalobacter formigenes]WAW06864.1 protease modulator HflK N-terminal domain-containing protein [Oxalobacter formigenes]